VKEENLVMLNTDKDDIMEQGLVGTSNGGDQASAETIDHGFQEDDNDVILLVTKKSTVPQQQSNGTKTESISSRCESMDPNNLSCACCSPSCSSCSDKEHDEEKGPQEQSLFSVHYQQQQQVTDDCAMCLEPYRVGEMIVWSETCPHVFHKDCFVEYLLSHRGSNGTPCPSCRQTYCDESVFCLSPDELKEDGDSSSSSLTFLLAADGEEPIVGPAVISEPGQEGEADDSILLSVDEEAPAINT
jgi:hypothetical protein